MKDIRRIATAGVAALALGGMAATTAAITASASTHQTRALQYKVINGHWRETASVRPSRINIITQVRPVVTTYIKGIHWSSWKRSSANGHGMIYYKGSAKGSGWTHRRASIRLSGLIGASPYLYYAHLKTDGTRYTWANVPGWYEPTNASAPASASSKPVVYECNNSAGHIRPGTLYIARSPAGGSGWWMTGLHWSRWNASTARGRGREYDSTYHATVTLSRVRDHDRTRYYTRMAVAAPRGFTSYAYLRWSWSSHEWRIG